MPISGCHDLPLATFNLPSRVFRHGWRRAECLERRWGGFFHTLGSGQPRMPPRERQHEGLGGLGDSFTRTEVDGTRVNAL